MSDQEQTQEQFDENQAGEGSDNQDGESQPAMPDRLTLLKQRADLMGIKYSNNIKPDTLAAKIEAKLSGETPPEDPFESEQDEQQAQEQAAPVSQLNPLMGDTKDKVVSKMSERERIRLDATKLIRCRIQNLDPKKKDLHGEIFTVGNDVVGTISKFVPYGEVTDDGYHLPHILYENLVDRKFLHIRVLKDRQTGRERVETSWQKEFAIEVLPQLTQEELNKLASAQLAASNG